MAFAARYRFEFDTEQRNERRRAENLVHVELAISHAG
jgi:hypothetical protein